MIRSLLLAALAVLASAVPASAYLVYVSNEKDNTIGVIDSGKLQVVKTFKVGAARAASR